MVEKILIIAEYPFDNQKEGMRQRILSIDKEFSCIERTYLSLAKFGNRKAAHTVIEDGRVDYYQLNIVLHRKQIIALLKDYNYIYIHSVENFTNLIFFNLKNKIITWDVHGVVPEEFDYLGSKIKYYYYNTCENKLASIANNIILVSNEMRDFYIEKYPSFSNKKVIVKPIYSLNVFKDDKEETLVDLRTSLGINDSDTVFIYAGNVQKWQNVEQMLSVCSSISKENYFFIFLTGSLDEFKRIMNNTPGTQGMRHVVCSVSPQELSKYYSISHYGFILRDKHLLNRVAAPTKLVEYLYYGITPIVKYNRVGDALSLGYEYINYDNIPEKLLPHKSEKNIEVAGIMASTNKNLDLLSEIE